MKRELHWLVVVLVRAAVIGVVERTQVTMSTMSISMMVASTPTVRAAAIPPMS